MISKIEFKHLKKFLCHHRNPQELKKFLNTLNLTENQKDKLNNNKLILKVDNKKLKNTLILNINSSLNCINCFNKECNIYKQCYARNQERIFKNYLVNNLINYVVFNTIDNINLINQIENALFIAEKPIYFIRINEAGEIENNKQLKRCEFIAKFFKLHKNLKTYTYTHTKNLNLNLCKNLNVINSNQDIKYISKLKDHQKDNIFCPAKCNIKNCNICKDKKYIEYLKNNNIKLDFYIHDSKHNIQEDAPQELYNTNLSKIKAIEKQIN